jgi:general secretion pathway protein H
MPMSVRGSERHRLTGAGRDAGLTVVRCGRRTHGFTLIELMIVLALVAVGTAVVSLALRDGAATRLEEEGARLAALLESARAESRASGLTVRWVPASPGDGRDPAADSGFRFVGLPSSITLPTRWLDPGTAAQVVGAPVVLLGPDAILPAQRVVLSLGDRRIEIGSDGLGPFAVLPAGDADAMVVR